VSWDCATGKGGELVVWIDSAAERGLDAGVDGTVLGRLTSDICRPLSAVCCLLSCLLRLI
jgi:hypothetical protein